MIQTRRLVLRPARDSDLDALHRVFSNHEAMRYWSHPAHDTLARTRDTLDGLIASYADTGLEFVLDRDGTVIGKAGMWRIGEIGYILHPDHWRQGLMHEALSALLPAAFARHATLAHLTAEIDPRNTASAALLTRLGFHETHRAERTIEIGGEWCDSSYWRLDRPSPA